MQRTAKEKDDNLTKMLDKEEDERNRRHGSPGRFMTQDGICRGSPGTVPCETCLSSSAGCTPFETLAKTPVLHNLTTEPR